MVSVIRQLVTNSSHRLLMIIDIVEISDDMHSCFFGLNSNINLYIIVRMCQSYFASIYVNIITGPYSDWGWPPEVCTKIYGSTFCYTVEHVQLKNVTVDVMNIIVTITVGVKCAPECIKIHHFVEKSTNFCGKGEQPPPRPYLVVTFGPRHLHSSEPPNHISGYGPVSWPTALVLVFG